MSTDDFRLRHSGEIRETLIMIEGESGGFELLKHGTLVPAGLETGVAYAVVRSADSGRTYFLVRDADAPGPLWSHWHQITQQNSTRLEAAA